MQLVRFLMKLASEYVQVELKNGTVVAGTVLSVAPNMNTVLKDVKMTVSGEDPVTMDTITLRGSSIRHFVLPDTLPLDRMISADERKPRTMAPPAKRGRGALRGSRGLRGRGRGSFRGARGSTRGRGRGMPRETTQYR